MKETYPSRIERLSSELGGRFKLTVMIQKRFQEVLRGGRAFAPSENTDVLFQLILDEIEHGRLALADPGEIPEPEEQPAES